MPEIIVVNGVLGRPFLYHTEASTIADQVEDGTGPNQSAFMVSWVYRSVGAERKLQNAAGSLINEIRVSFFSAIQVWTGLPVSGGNKTFVPTTVLS